MFVPLSEFFPRLFFSLWSFIKLLLTVNLGLFVLDFAIVRLLKCNSIKPKYKTIIKTGYLAVLYCVTITMSVLIVNYLLSSNPFVYSEFTILAIVMMFSLLHATGFSGYNIPEGERNLG